MRLTIARCLPWHALLALLTQPVWVCSVRAGSFDALETLNVQYGFNVSNLQSSYPWNDPASSVFRGPAALWQGCSAACSALKLDFPGTVVSKNTSAFADDQAGFWSERQAEVQPQCFFAPDSAREVAIAVLLSQITQCPFAVKSGGHAPFANASNIGGGLTILLSKFTEVTLSDDGTKAAVGPGNTWGTTYTALEQYNRTAIGGRIAGIGVGGLTLGGGISYFSGLHGWACDNVYNYQVVTADGAIIDANPDEHSDLYWALRGGGNNFGIVTRFDLFVYPQGQMFGGSLVFTEDQLPAELDFLVQFTNDAPSDPRAALIVAIISINGSLLSSVNPEYADPVTNASIFSDLYKIPHVSDSTKVQWQSNITYEMDTGTPPGLREDYWNYVFQLDRDFLDFALDVFRDEVSKVQYVPGYANVIAFQQQTLPVLQEMQKNGGNALGLDPEDGPIIIMNLSSWWYNADDDAAAIGSSRKMIARITAEAKRRGLHNRFIYQNYASPEQKVFESYGEENWNRLKEISRKYDPRQVFEVLQPGYHKLNM